MELSFLHLSNIALGTSPSPGPNTVSVIVNGEECVLATLEASGSTQHELEGTIFDSTSTFRNRGKSPVYLLGKFTTSTPEDDEEDEDDLEELSDLDGESSSSSEEECPEGTPLDMVPPTNPELLRLNGSRMGQGAAALRAGAPDDDGGDDDDDDDDGDDTDSAGDDEGGEEEEQPQSQPPPQKAGKRSAPAVAVEVAESKSKAKKARQATEGAAAAAGPSESERAGGPASDDAQAYESSLVAHLSKQPGRTAKLPTLGSAVKKPAGVPKLAAFLRSRPAMFRSDEREGTVTLLRWSAPACDPLALSPCVQHEQQHGTQHACSAAAGPSVCATLMPAADHKWRALAHPHAGSGRTTTRRAFTLQLTLPAPPAAPTPPPKAATPKAPTPKAPTPTAPTPKALTPKAPTPKALTPKAPTPKVPTPKAPTPKAPTPKAPTPTAAPALSMDDVRAAGGVYGSDAGGAPAEWGLGSTPAAAAGTAHAACQWRGVATPHVPVPAPAPSAAPTPVEGVPERAMPYARSTCRRGGRRQQPQEPPQQQQAATATPATTPFIRRAPDDVLLAPSQRQSPATTTATPVPGAGDTGAGTSAATRGAGPRGASPGTRLAMGVAAQAAGAAACTPAAAAAAPVGGAAAPADGCTTNGGDGHDDYECGHVDVDEDDAPCDGDDGGDENCDPAEEHAEEAEGRPAVAGKVQRNGAGGGWSRASSEISRRKSLSSAGMQAGVDGTRRSTRAPQRPLEYWRNERKVFGRAHKSLPTVVRVETRTPNPSWPDNGAMADRAKTKSRPRTKA
ncbi:hypothetical protein FOA52_008033 [Chlamydomonas sp. UWO 241]|nr:hypothetical protein FOA52_008033 [Chlamydomonas sp. UWO 241]